MARPKKKGIDYFPFDVYIFDDEKLFDVQNRYGPLGEVIYIRLLCLVYSKGYYFEFGSLDKLAAMVIRSVGNRWARDKNTVKDVISYLAECNLFSAELMQRNILTSHGIQVRYLLATERRQSRIEEYSLLSENESQTGFVSIPENQVNAEETGVNVTETPVIDSDNTTKKSKQKESKTNYIKSDYIKEDEITADNAFSEISDSVSEYQSESESNKIINLIPSFEEVLSYADENGITTSVAKFYEYYTRSGWRTKNGDDITDWKATLRFWAEQERIPQRNNSNNNNNNNNTVRNNGSYYSGSKYNVSDGSRVVTGESMEDVYKSLVYNIRE